MGYLGGGMKSGSSLDDARGLGTCSTQWVVRRCLLVLLLLFVLIYYRDKLATV